MLSFSTLLRRSLFVSPRVLFPSCISFLLPVRSFATPRASAKHRISTAPKKRKLTPAQKLKNLEAATARKARLIEQAAARKSREIAARERKRKARVDLPDIWALSQDAQENQQLREQTRKAVLRQKLLARRETVRDRQETAREQSLVKWAKRQQTKSLEKSKPKRPLTAYLLFFKEKSPVYRNELSKSGKSVREIIPESARRTAAAWKQLTEEQKQPYKTNARSARADYDAELAVWKSAHPAPPTRPAGSYMRFANQRRPQIHQQNPQLPLIEQSRLIAQEWKKLTSEQKAQYTRQYEQEAKQYQARLNEWKQKQQSELDKTMDSRLAELNKQRDNSRSKTPRTRTRHTTDTTAASQQSDTGTRPQTAGTRTTHAPQSRSVTATMTH